MITSSGIALFYLFILQFHIFADQTRVKQGPPTLITLTVQAAPASRQDFRFHSTWGDFRLDQTALDDDDAITQSVTFTLPPGALTTVWFGNQQRGDPLFLPGR